MRRWGLGQLLATVGVAVAFWAIVAAGCMCVGSTGSVRWPHQDEYAFHIRLEIVLVASLVGAALGAAGVAYQAILRNPLADPYLLGVSSGASLWSLLWYVGALSAGPLAWQAAGQQGLAFVGAMVSVGVAFLVATRRGRLDPVTLILVGVIVNAVNGSLFLLVYFRHPEITARGGAFLFLVGGIQTNLTGQQEWVTAVVVAAGAVALAYAAGQLNVATLGEAEAEALGVRIHRLRWGVLVTASLVTASAVAISGPIGFVGLICPHLARLMVGQDQRRLLPTSIALAAALLAAADAASRYLSQPGLLGSELPVGVLTGLLGGPFFLLLLWRNRREGFG